MHGMRPQDAKHGIVSREMPRVWPRGNGHCVELEGEEIGGLTRENAIDRDGSCFTRPRRLFGQSIRAFMGGVDSFGSRLPMRSEDGVLVDRRVDARHSSLRPACESCADHQGGRGKTVAGTGKTRTKPITRRGAVFGGWSGRPNIVGYIGSRPFGGERNG